MTHTAQTAPTISRRLRNRRSCLALFPLALGLVAGCVEFESERSEPIEAVADLQIIGVTPSSNFGQDGRAELALLPKNSAGEVVTDGDFDVEVKVEQIGSFVVEGTTVQIEGYQVTEPRQETLVFALDIDCSGSMRDNDPARLRVQAAGDFVDMVHGYQPNAELGIFTFGSRAQAPFSHTEMLQDFTTDSDATKQSLSDVYAHGKTPMYESTYELLTYLNDARRTADYQPILVLFADGHPNGKQLSSASPVIAHANTLGIPIYSVGLGPASQTSRYAEPKAVEIMQDLAYSTGGVYAAATDASELSQTFTNLGEGLSEGHLVVSLVIDPTPPPGTWVAGTIEVNGASSAWGFITPSSH